MLKNGLLFKFCLLLVSVLFLQNSVAQNYTQWALPEGAKARLGKGKLNDLQYSPDGTVLAVASSIGIWLYDTETYKERTLLTEHRSIRHLSFSPDGRTLASTSWGLDGITLWDVETGTHRKGLIQFESSGSSLSFSPDGRTLASGGRFEDIILWDTVTGKPRHTFKELIDFVKNFSFSPDGRTFAIARATEGIILLDVETGTHKKTLKGHTGSVFSVSFSPDGGTLVGGSSDETIHLWDVATGEHKKTLKIQRLIHESTGHGDAGENVSFSPDGRTLVSWRRGSPIRLWDLNTGEHKLLGEPTHLVTNVSFSPDGRDTRNQYLGSYHPLMGYIYREAEKKHHRRVLIWDTIHYARHLLLSPDGRKLVSVTLGRDHLLVGYNHGAAVSCHRARSCWFSLIV